MIDHQKYNGAKAMKARRAVRHAIKMGRLVRPEICLKCGKNPGRGADGRQLIQGHHYKGYDYPLDVEWLCAKCHAEETNFATGDMNAMRLHPESRLVGESHPQSILTDAQAIAISKDKRSVNVVAAIYGVGTSTVQRIRRGRAWTHVTGLKPHRVTTDHALLAFLSRPRTSITTPWSARWTRATCARP